MSPTPDRAPLPGELWSLESPVGHGIFLGGGLWNILVNQFDEYRLTQLLGQTPVALSEYQPDGLHWADQFDALAAAGGLSISWASEILTYQMEGLLRTRKTALQR